MNLAKTISAAAVAGVTVTMLGASPASALPNVEISMVQYDSPGGDSGTNHSLNSEWVRITNHSDQIWNMQDWKLRDAQGHTFVFPDFNLRPDRRVWVHTGTGTNDRNDLYWGSGRYIWGNSGDKAKLRSRAGSLVDMCVWGDGSGSTTC